MVGPLVKTQTLFLTSGVSSGYNFQANVNGLVSCKSDEILRVSIASLNVFNSFQQINDTNDTIYYTHYPTDGGSSTHIVQVPHGNYPLDELARQLSVPDKVAVTYDAFTNKMRLEAVGGQVAFFVKPGLVPLLGFSAGIFARAQVHVSDLVCVPHSVNEIVVNLDGLTPHENAAPVDNFSNETDTIDVGHVIAVVPVGEVYRRTVWYNNSPEFNSFFVAEKSVNTLRVRLTDWDGQPLTWVNSATSLTLLFETYQIE